MGCRWACTVCAAAGGGVPTPPLPSDTPLPSDLQELEPGQRLLAAGWGKTPGATAFTPNPPTLMYTELEAVDTLDCQEWFSLFNQTRLISDDGGDLCAGSLSPNSTCSGDSGGPLLLPGGMQVGVASHGLYGEAAREGNIGGCGSPAHLTAFASVSHFRAWIDATLEAEGLL